ncbi:mitochondrial fission regulator 1-like [Centruroides vittatus]|uniref:mitochondrial fission regulator 1-like n=1 Tax=Centruroides vittatus TaxID=120091 RepID=UPI0035100455
MWKGKQVGRRRSIVRRMSSWFPVILPPKIYVKVNVIKNSSDKLVKPSCLNSSLSKLHDGLNIITTLLDKTADNYVYWRTDVSVVNVKSTSSDEKKSLLQSESSKDFIVPEPRSSTPISFLQNANAVSNQSALIRICQLEDELAFLRQQIASIVISQEGSLCKTSSDAKTMPSTSSLPSLPPPPPPPPPPLPPPMPSSSHPLPPPPPPPLQFHSKSQLSKVKLNEKKKSKKITSTKDKPVNGSDDKKSLPDMSEILKGINSIKLRHVERSPGGTPIRKPPLPSDPSDPATLLAVALKRRFSRIHPHESSPEKENQELSEGLAESSPITNTNKPFGPFMLKPVKKRETKLFSPLTEMNE